MTFRPSWPKDAKPKWFGSLSTDGAPMDRCPFCSSPAEHHEEGSYIVKEGDGEILVSYYGVGATLRVRFCDGKKPVLN